MKKFVHFRRLLAHSDKSNKTIVVLDNLAFPNGLEFGPNEEYLLISETARARVRRYSKCSYKK